MSECLVRKDNNKTTALIESSYHYFAYIVTKVLFIVILNEFVFPENLLITNSLAKQMIIKKEKHFLVFPQRFSLNK